MTKKTTTVPATVSPLSLAIAADAALVNDLGAKDEAGARDIAAAFDLHFGSLDWGLYKGNSSAAKCGMSDAAFKGVKDARTDYRDAFKEAGLEKKFDSRWQYIGKLSAHYDSRGRITDVETARLAAEAEAEARDKPPVAPNAESADTVADKILAVVKSQVEYGDKTETMTPRLEAILDQLREVLESEAVD
jgi:hypothetical protein